MKSNRMITRFIMVLALIMAPYSVLAQVTKGSISGNVADASGALIGDASVKATNTATGTVLQTQTEKAGNFRFSLVPPGTYRIEISKTGFNSRAIEKVIVQTSQDSSLGVLTLAIAGSQVNVEVSDTYTPLIEASQAQVTSTFSTQNLALLTGIGENQGLDVLALLVPGVNASRDLGYANSNGVKFASNGIRGRNNDQQIDGQNNNDNSVSGPSLQVSDAEFVSEYQIITNNFGPEYGRNGGSVVNVVTKSGTNDLHGSIYGYWTNNQLETLTNVEKEFESLTSLPRSNTEFGGATLGFPIIKNKLFFFNGFNEQLYHVTAVRHSDSITPTPTGLTQAASCSWVDSAALAALKAYGPYGFSTGNPVATDTRNVTLTSSGTSCVIQMGGVTRSVPERNHAFNWLPRVDYQNGKDTITARYLLDRNNWFDLGDNSAAGYFYNEPALAQAIKLGWTRALTERMVNELSVSFSRNNVQFGGSSNNSDPSMGNVDQAVATISISKTSGYSSLGYGTGASYPQGRIVNTWQIQDNFNYQLGKHHLKAGVNWTYQRSPNVFLPYINGSFSFSNWTNYFLSRPTSIKIASGDPKLDFREYDTFMYAGDDWQISPNLTVNLGLTYSFYGQPANIFHDKDTKIQNSSNPLWSTALDQSITTAPHMDSDFKLFAPSVGFAWSPTFLGHQTVIRGGYRLAYDPPFYNIYLNMASSAPQVLLQTLSGTKTYSVLPSTPTGPNVRSALSSYLTRGVSDPRTNAQTQLDKNFTSDQVHSWSVGIQRELSKGIAGEVRYVGNHGTNLFQSVNANPYLYGLKANFSGQVPTSISLGTNGREDGNSTVIRNRKNSAWSDYHALQAQVRADNLFDQLMLTASYTFSKTTDNASEIYGSGAGGGTVAFSQNPLNYGGAEHGLSGLDFPHNFTFSFAEQIPAYKQQNGLIGHALGGWSVSGTYYLASGQTYSPTQYYFYTYGNYYACVYGSAYGNCNTDYLFNATFGTSYDGLRPFTGNHKADPKKVGVYAGDACSYWSLLGGDTSTCSESSTELIDWSVNNQSGGATINTVSADAVRYIMNGTTAQSVKNTPWGDVKRNDARDFWTNTADLSVMKSIKLRSNMKAQLRANFSNVFNHPNYSTIDPYLEDTGDYAEGDGFADPKVQSGGRRIITFSGKITW